MVPNEDSSSPPASTAPRGFSAAFSPDVLRTHHNQPTEQPPAHASFSLSNASPSTLGSTLAHTTSDISTALSQADLDDRTPTWHFPADPDNPENKQGDSPATSPTRDASGGLTFPRAPAAVRATPRKMFTGPDDLATGMPHYDRYT